MPLLNASPLALPSGADTEGAWQEAIDLPNLGAGKTVARITPGQTYEQVLTGNMSYAADGTAGNRQVFATVVDANGVQVMTAVATITQAPGTTVNYSLHGDGSPSYSPSASQAVIGFPPVLLLPGWQFAMLVLNPGPGDTFSAIGLLYLRIPTRPPQRAPEILLPTPILV